LIELEKAYHNNTLSTFFIERSQTGSIASSDRSREALVQSPKAISSYKARMSRLFYYRRQFVKTARQSPGRNSLKQNRN
jgi:hypothetical protein